MKSNTNPYYVGAEHTFDQQVALAQAEQNYHNAIDKYGGMPGMWNDYPPRAEAAVIPETMSTGQMSMDQIHTALQDPNFSEFVNEAYEAPEGYAIRVNPVTGKKEMMVAGTRHATQWLLNAYDSALYGGDKALKVGLNAVFDHGTEYVRGIAAEHVGPLAYLIPHFHVKGVKLLERADPWRQNKQKMYSDIAKEQGVDVVYGHSRGGAMVADMRLPKGTQKVGLDAAMLIAHHTGTLNINEGGGYNPLGLFDEFIGLTGKQNVTYDASYWSPHKVWKT